MTDYLWEIRNPDGAALGLEVARGRSGEHRVMLAHALPERVDIWIFDDDGRIVAEASGLQGGASTPIARLVVEDGGISRKNVWPGAEDLGRPVILPGGEIGILTSWWNAEDGSEWRWSIELHNHA